VLLLASLSAHVLAAACTLLLAGACATAAGAHAHWRVLPPLRSV
jgi:hypothetical protein